jgi:hypothetical protein
VHLSDWPAERLVGMQAQAPFPPYFGLLSRLDGFRPDDLPRLLLSRDVVRVALMCGNIHLSRPAAPRAPAT